MSPNAINFFQVFLANVDSSSVMKIRVISGVRGQLFKIVPVTWYNRPCLRLELYGCPTGKCEHYRSRESWSFVQRCASSLQTSRQREVRYQIVEFGAKSDLLVKQLLDIVVTGEKIYYE